MNRIMEWIIRHWKISIIILMCMIIAPAVLCQILYKFSTPWKWSVGEFSAGELLGYLGGALAFAGTLILGFIAIKQNNDLKILTEHQNKTNDLMMKLADNANEISLQMLEFERQRTLPFLVFCKEKSEIKKNEDGNTWISLVFKNKTDNDVIDYEISIEDNNVIKKIIEEENIDLNNWYVPMISGVQSVDLSQEDCNVSICLDFENYYACMLFVKVKVVGREEYIREQHFKFMILKNIFTYARPIIV